jgi:hypothetical protein
MMNPLAPGAAPAVNALRPQAAPQQARMFHPDPGGFVKGMNLSQPDITKYISLADYAAKQTGALARNPDVNYKDVINSMGQAVADGMVTPTQAVARLSQVPQDADKLKPWLDQQYAGHLAAAVHLKAIAMGAPQPQQAPAAPMQGAAPMNPNAAPMPGSAPEPVAAGV